VQGEGLTSHMRAILVDWLVTVACEYELMPSTLYQCIDLIDRSLSCFLVPKDE
jgi:cyclin A